MKRRQFLAAAAVSAGPAAAALAEGADRQEARKHAFKLKYAPHFGMFRHSGGEDLVDQLKFAAGRGFTAWEDNGMRQRPVGVQKRVAQAMEKLGIDMGVLVAAATFKEVTFAGTDKAARERVLQDIRDSVEVAKRVRARWMT